MNLRIILTITFLVKGAIAMNPVIVGALATIAAEVVRELLTD
jgi:hypothetical protein